MKTRYPKSLRIGFQVVVAIAALLVAGRFIAHDHLSENLVDATMQRDYGRMEADLKWGADPDYLFDGSTSSLQAAIENEDLRAIDILLRQDASVEKLDGHHRRLLFVLRPR